MLCDIHNIMLALTNVMRLDIGQYKLVKSLCKYSKNLYNQGLYNTRQEFFQNNRFLQYKENYHLCKESENYKMLQAATAQQSLKFVERGMRSFFGLIKLYRDGNLPVRPSLPHYLPKEKGLFAVAFPKNAFSIRDGIVRLGVSRNIIKNFPNAHKQLRFPLPPPLEGKEIREIHILPIYFGLYFKIKYCYQDENEIVDLDNDKYLSIDLGLDNFATFVDNCTGTATIIDGMYIKSINQWYNKRNAELQSIKDMHGIEGPTENQHRLAWKRGNKMGEFMNQAVSYIIKHCLANRIGNVLIGELGGIKQRINHGKKNNQEFVQIPYGKFKAKLESKCQRFGIKYHLVDEAYTSRTDALAFDEIRDQPYGKTRRIKSGLFKSITGTVINADVNGSLNILRNVAGDSPAKEIISRGLVNRPKRIKLAYEVRRTLESN
ncbi:MAG TPA: transposase [Methanotrichaceae archaeon]|nr:transposase [Methanotrichaceae archaeon]